MGALLSKSLPPGGRRALEYGESLALAWLLYKTATHIHRKGAAAVLMGGALSVLKSVPGVAGVLERENEKILEQLEEVVNAGGNQELGELQRHFPQEGSGVEELVAWMEKAQAAEWDKVGSGKACGGVYRLEEHGKRLSQAYAIFSSANCLFPDLFPSARKFELELVAWACDMLNGGADTCGSITSGGSESILMAVKTHRDWARSRGIEHGNIIVSDSTHPAFSKACHYLGVQCVTVPVDGRMRMDVHKAKAAVNRNTIMMMGSAPGFPHGVIDPIEELALFAQQHGVGFHVDCCLGGFYLPWLQRAGTLKVPFDFRVPGVTSISCDPHKYGYADKGVSCILYHSRELRKFQFHATTDWMGGLYASPTVAGSRSGALIAQAWMSLKMLGANQLTHLTLGMQKCLDHIAAGLRDTDGIEVMGPPDACVVAYTTTADSGVDVFALAECMEEDMGWEAPRIHRPKGIHVVGQLRLVGQQQQYVDAVREALRRVQTSPEKYSSGLAPIYGMAAELPERGVVGQLLTEYLDRLYAMPRTT